MPVYVALLRGVNVGGKNRLPNATLAQACEAARFDSPKAYLQSGNVVFRATGGRIAERLRDSIRDAAGLDVPVLIREASEIAAVVARNPFPDCASNRLLVFFLGGTVTPAAREKIEKYRAARESVAYAEREIFACFPDGVGTSKLGAAMHDRNLGVLCTARNWTTVQALAELAATLTR